MNAQDLTKNNKHYMNRTTTCVCQNCKLKFQGNFVEYWIDSTTAKCPNCGKPTVEPQLNQQ